MSEQKQPEQPDVVTVTVADGYAVFDPALGEQVGGGAQVSLPRADAERALRHGYATSDEVERPAPSSAGLSRRRQG